MSKILLSRIKPRHNSNCKPPRSPPFNTRIKELVNEVVKILESHEQWEETLETRLSQEESPISDVAYHLFNRIGDVNLGLKFFDWIKQSPYSYSLNGYAYSSLLTLLANSKEFAEIETVIESMRGEDKLPTSETMSVVIQAYSDSGLVDKALEFYNFVKKEHCLMPNLLACNSLLNALTKCGRIRIARLIYDEMIQTDSPEKRFVDNHSTCIIVRGLCEEGKVDEGKKLIENRWGKNCIPNIVFL